MEPKAALELLVAGLNRAAFNPLEKAGLNSAVKQLADLIDKCNPPTAEPQKKS